MELKDRILLIEDDVEFRLTLAEVLRDEGYLVEEAGCGQDAIELAGQVDFDLVISDVRMPGGIDGIETIMRIKNAKPDKKVYAIVITGYADVEAPLRAIKAGVDDYISKPFKLDYFLHSVRRLLRLKRLEKEKEDYIREIQEMKERLEEYSLRLEKEVEEKTKELRLLFELGREFTSTLDLNVVLQRVVDRIINIFSAHSCAILLWDLHKEKLRVSCAKGLDPQEWKNTELELGEMISGWVLQTGKSYLSYKIDAEPEILLRNKQEKYYAGPFMSVPMLVKGKRIGVINVSGRDSGTFTMADLCLLEGIASQASVAIDNARLWSDLERVYLQIMMAINTIIGLKDNYTRIHSENVTRYSVAIAEEMGLSAEQVDTIRIAAQLHDVGKIGIPDYILTKPGKLTDEEWEKMKEHPLKGAEIVSLLPFLNGVKDIIIHHHERYDGTGYPFGKKGQEIPLGARIVAVADAFDAMTTDRPYRKAMSLDVAKQELIKGAISQFDPDVVRVFIKVLEERPQIAKRS